LGTRITVALIAAVFVGVMAVAYGMRSWGKPSKKVRAASLAPDKKLARRPTGSISVKITPTGFEPSEVSCSEGAYLIGVYNRSGLRTVDLQLDREAGNRLHEVTVPREMLDWKRVVELAPGRYILSEVNHPEWSCKINVSAQ